VLAPRQPAAYLYVMDESPDKPTDTPPAPALKPVSEAPLSEQGGPKGPEPTRYGDWEVGGVCSDF